MCTPGFALSIMKKIGILVFYALLVSLCAGCNIFERWDAIVYPVAGNREESLDVGTYNSLEECRAAALAKLGELHIHAEIGDYICGKNCMVKDGFSNARMCGETSQ